MNFLVTACQRAEEEEIAEQRRILESDSKIAENEVFMGAIILLNHSFLERDDTNIENNETNNWEDKFGNEPTSKTWIRSRESSYTKSKLI